MNGIELFLIIIIVILLVYNENLNKTQEKIIRNNGLINVNFTDIEDKLDTGDLIFMSCDYNKTGLEYLFGDEHTHVAMVVRKIDGLYIFEANIGENNIFRLSQPYKHVVKLTKLSDYLNKYKKKPEKLYIRARLLNSKISEETRRNLEKNILKFCNYKYRWETLPFIIKGITTAILDKNLNDKYVQCSELIAKLLENAGIIKVNMSLHLIRPEQLFYDEKIIYLRFIKYLPPININY